MARMADLDAPEIHFKLVSATVLHGQPLELTWRRVAESDKWARRGPADLNQWYKLCPEGLAEVSVILVSDQRVRTVREAGGEAVWPEVMENTWRGFHRPPDLNAWLRDAWPGWPESGALSQITLKLTLKHSPPVHAGDVG